MQVKQIIDHFLEISSLARRFYGLKLMFKNGLTDSSKWFLFNREKLKFEIDLKMEGIVLDIGAYKGEFTGKMLSQNRNVAFWLYEPVPEYFQTCADRFIDDKLVSVYRAAVSAEGRDLAMQVDGLRSRKALSDTGHSVTMNSIGIQDIFDSAKEFELLKMNIEGMEFECLEKLISTGSLTKAKRLLIQFHDFESDSEIRYDRIRESIEGDFDCIWRYKWIWELWTRKKE